MPGRRFVATAWSKLHLLFKCQIAILGVDVAAATLTNVGYYLAIPNVVPTWGLHR